MLDFVKKIFSSNKQKDINLKKRGNEYLATGDLVKAEECYRQYTSDYPNDAEGYVNLGYVLNEQKHYEQAQSYLLKAISLDPKQADAFYFLGLTYQQTGAIEKAIDYYQLALSVNPCMEVVFHQLYHIYSENMEVPKAKILLTNSAINNTTCALAQYYAGCINLNENSVDVALEFFHKAVILDPHNELVYLQMGNAYQKKGEYGLAVKDYQQAIAINPNLVEAYNNLGFVLQKQNQYDEAIATYQKAIEINNESHDLFNNLGAAFYHKGDFQTAISAYQRAIELNPSFAAAYSNVARAFNELHNFEETIINYEKAFQLGIETQDIANKIACALRMQGKFDEAVEKYRQALLIPADDAIANITHSNLLFAYTYCKYPPMQYLDEAKAYGRRVSSKAIPYQRWLVDQNSNSDRPLRIGLVSADLYAHPVGLFIHGLLANINKDQFQMVVYANGKRTEDALSQFIQSHVLAWHNINDVSDEIVAKQIHDDRIDILIDLSGHTGGNRLALFAWKPAPVQVTWLGYWASTGVSEIDTILVDSSIAPIDDQIYFSEKLYHLPATRMCFAPPPSEFDPGVSPLPALTNGYITFGSFQNVVKMNDDVFVLWSKVLAALPTARLRLQSQIFNDANVRTRIWDLLAAAGIDRARVTIKPPQNYRDYLIAHSEVDIVLDTFPFPGGTTTCESLWMGVPTVALPKNTMVSRVSASMLTCAGLQDWVANTEAEYIAIAINKANDINALAQLRAGLREQARNSPLFNSELFARHFEQAMREIWREKISMLS